jgi:putative peptidoglycan lipid II flippase
MSIVKNTFVVGVFTLFSRLIGFIRECIMAFCLGAGMYSDALLVALRIANLFRRIFAEGAFNASFLPSFSKILNKEGKDAANVVLSDVFSMLMLILIPFSVIIIIFFPSFLKLLLSGFDELGEKFALTVLLGRICFPYLIFISIASLFCGVMNSINKFALSSAVYSMLSIFTISGLLIGYFLDLSRCATSNITVWCVLLSGAAQSCLLFVSVVNHGFKIRFNFHCVSDSVKKIMKNMINGIIGAGVWQLNLFVDMTISSYLPTGTITCINLADRLNQFPLGTLGIALSTALLPSLSKHLGRQDYDKVVQEMEHGLAFSFFLTLFATSVLIALSEQSVSVAFQRGMFEASHVRITADAVLGFAIGLPAYVLTKVFSSLYFAAGDTKSPVIFGIVSVVLNIIFLILLIPFFKYFGLALCTSLSAVSNAGMLIYFSGKKVALKFSKNFWIKIISQSAATLTTCFTLSQLSDIFWDPNFAAKSIAWLVYFLFLICAVIVFFLTAVVCMYISGQDRWKLWKKSAW